MGGVRRSHALALAACAALLLLLLARLPPAPQQQQAQYVLVTGHQPAAGRQDRSDASDAPAAVPSTSVANPSSPPSLEVAPLTPLASRARTRLRRPRRPAPTPSSPPSISKNVTQVGSLSSIQVVARKRRRRPRPPRRRRRSTPTPSTPPSIPKNVTQVGSLSSIQVVARKRRRRPRPPRRRRRSTPTPSTPPSIPKNVTQVGSLSSIQVVARKRRRRPRPPRRRRRSTPTPSTPPSIPKNVTQASSPPSIPPSKTVTSPPSVRSSSPPPAPTTDTSTETGHIKMVVNAPSSSSNPPPVNETAAAPRAPPAPAPAAPAAPPAKPAVNKAQPRVVLTKELYEAGHSAPHPELCPRLGAGLKLLVLVTSAPSHSAARAAVRLTWGHFAARSDVAAAFMLGQPPQDMRASIEAEDALYGDIIMGNFVDSYSNLTLKTLSMLEWAGTYCPRAPRLLKTDDDMFINVPKLLQFMAQPTRVNATKTIWGKVLKKALPKRIPKSKYYLSRVQFPGRVLPDFTTGPAYLLTADAAPLLLGAAGAQPYVRLEDVFVTGLLADRCGVRRTHAHEFYNKKVSPHPCAIQRGVAIHMVQYHEQFDLWRKLLDGKTRCS